MTSADAEPQAFVEAALAASAADGCVVIATEHSEANLRFARNSLTTNGQMRSRDVTVISTFSTSAGTSAGAVTRSVASLEEIDDLVRAADDAGRDAAPADDAAPLVEDYPHDDDWSGEAATTGIEVFTELVDGLADAFDRWRGQDLELYGFAEHHLTSTFLGSSTGLRRRFDQPDGRLELNGKSVDLARSAWSGVHTRDFAGIDIAAATESLARRLEWATTSIDLPPGRYETLLPPTAVADLMIYLYWTASARDAEEGRTVFSGRDGGTRIGEQLASLPLALRSDPSAEGLQCAPFEIARQSYGGLQSVFDNGQPVDATSWVEGGTLRELMRTRAWAARTGAQPRQFIDNLIVDGGGTASLDEMIARTERGLLLTSLWYIREVDPQTLLLTGLTRDGVYLVEDGEIRGAVNNFRFNESPVDLLGRVTEVGRTEPTLSREWNDDFRRTAMAPMRVPDFNMSTVSKAS